ncbi:MAG: thiolase domain-containing protein [Deltaproteobacteria bacterium]|nr:thiolase domain-containing protein [Deltaproteobacteria bacterium]
MSGVYVLGGFQTDFARNAAREGVGVGELVDETVRGTLADAGLEASAIEVIHVGNAFGELFTGQAQLGAMPATMYPALWGVPGARHEAACASGSIALLAAAAELEAGRYDCALVIGVEQERNVGGEVAARHLGAAAWIGHEAAGVRFVWPQMFADIEEAYAARWGLDRRWLGAIAAQNLGNAKDNPLAQTRAWTFPPEAFTEDDIANPLVAGRLRRTDCAQLTDGGAGVILASERFARDHAARRGTAIAALARIRGWGHRTAGLGLGEKLDRSRAPDHLLPHVRAAILDAYRRADLEGPAQLDGIETHDCFTITQYLALDHFGLTAPGESWRAVADGRTARGGALPVNPGGGLIGIGHPVGATGVRMFHDAARQVTGAAGAAQVSGARTFATLNLGGSGTTAVSFVLGGAA